MVTGGARVEPLDDGRDVPEDGGVHQGCQGQGHRRRPKGEIERIEERERGNNKNRRLVGF